MQFNVATLLQEPVGSTREMELEGEVAVPEQDYLSHAIVNAFERPSPIELSTSISPDDTGGALLDGDGLRQVARLVHIQPTRPRYPVGEQL